MSPLLKTATRAIISRRPSSRHGHSARGPAVMPGPFCPTRRSKNFWQLRRGAESRVADHATKPKEMPKCRVLTIREISAAASLMRPRSSRMGVDQPARLTTASRIMMETRSPSRYCADRARTRVLPRTCTAISILHPQKRRRSGSSIYPPATFPKLLDNHARAARLNSMPCSMSAKLLAERLRKENAELKRKLGLE